MYIAQGLKPNNPFINYVIGLVIIILGWLILGTLPLYITVFIKALNSSIPFPKGDLALMKFFESNFFLTLYLSSFIIGLASLYFTVKYLHKMSWMQITTTRFKIDYHRILFAFVIWALFIGITAGIDIYNNPENYQFHFQPIPFFILLLISIFLLPFQTSFEEYLFRGYLMQGFGVLFKDKFVALFLTSVLFGLLHLANPEVDKLGNLVMIYYIGMGFFLGIITLMDDGLELALGVHAANNIITALLITSDWSALQTYSIYKDITKNPAIDLYDIIPLIVTFTIFIYIFAKKYNWNNWSEKLAGKIKPINIIK